MTIKYANIGSISTGTIEAGRDLPMSITIAVDVFALAACAQAASKEETRYYLRGVHVRRDETGTTYEAADGHCAIVVRDTRSGGEPFSVIVPTELCRKPIRTAPRMAKLEVSEAVLALNGVMCKPMPEGAVYPDIGRLVPDAASATTGVQAHISPIVSAQVHKAAQILGGKGMNLPIFLPTDGPTAPCIGLFDAGEGREGFALVMPVKGSRTEWSRPGWI